MSENNTNLGQDIEKPSLISANEVNTKLPRKNYHFTKRLESYIINKLVMFLVLYSVNETHLYITINKYQMVNFSL